MKEEMPLSFKMELAHNVQAMNSFLKLDENSQQKIIERAREIKTKREMNRLVSDIPYYT